LLKIQTVATDLNRLQSEIRQLHETANKLDDSTLLTDKENYNMVSILQKKCLVFTEELMKNLLHLDSLVNLPQSGRPLRKQQVTAIQTLIDDVDKVNLKLRKLKEVEDERRKEEGKRQIEEENNQKKQKEEKKKKKNKDKSSKRNTKKKKGKDYWKLNVRKPRN